MIITTFFNHPNVSRKRSINPPSASLFFMIVVLVYLLCFIHGLLSFLLQQPSDAFTRWWETRDDMNGDTNTTATNEDDVSINSWFDLWFICARKKETHPLFFHDTPPYSEWSLLVTSITNPISFVRHNRHKKLITLPCWPIVACKSRVMRQRDETYTFRYMTSGRSFCSPIDRILVSRTDQVNMDILSQLILAIQLHADVITSITFFDFQLDAKSCHCSTHLPNAAVYSCDGISFLGLRSRPQQRTTTSEYATTSSVCKMLVWWHSLPFIGSNTKSWSEPPCQIMRLMLL
jgi:hypothetical protein